MGFNRETDITSQDNLQSDSRQKIKEDNKFFGNFMVFFYLFLTIITFPFCLYHVLFVVRQFERAVIFRNGKVYNKRAFGPGLVFHLPCIDTFNLIDLRTICYDFPPQEVLTKDSLSISVDAVVFYKIDDPVAAIINVENYKESTQYLAATTLRNALGTRMLTEALVNREAIRHQVFQLMKNSTKVWGIQIERVEIKDMILPLQLQKAMAAEAESTRLANAKIIVAQAEIECLKNLQKATEMLTNNPFAMQLRYLQTLQTIAGEKTHTIVFPFSVEVKPVLGKDREFSNVDKFRLQRAHVCTCNRKKKHTKINMEYVTL